jgi:hypothetical protein
MGKYKTRLCPSCGERLPPGLYRLQIAPPELREDLWHGDVGKYLLGHPEPLTGDQVLVEGLGLPISQGGRVRVGRILHALGRRRVRRVKNGVFMGYEYVQPATPISIEASAILFKPKWKKREEAHLAPPPAPRAREPKLSHSRVTGDELYDPVSRWLLDLGDVPITVDQVLLGLRQPLTRVLQVRVGWILRAFGRERVRRWIDGKRAYVYERPRRREAAVEAPVQLVESRPC